MTDMPFGKGWASRRETGTFSELACGLCLQTGDRLSCMLAQDKTWEARGAASPGHHPERDMYGRRGLVSGGRRRSSSCCGLTSEKMLLKLLFILQDKMEKDLIGNEKNEDD